MIKRQQTMYPEVFNRYDVDGLQIYTDVGSFRSYARVVSPGAKNVVRITREECLRLFRDARKDKA